MHGRAFFRNLKSGLAISILLCFCLLDCQPQTQVSPPPTSGQALYSFDFSNAARFAITTAFSQIPEVGSLLSGLVHIFWPSSQVDVWSEIKDQVQTLITQDLKNFKYSDIQTALGSLKEGSGLIGALQNYLNSKTNGQDPAVNWGSANTAFITSLSKFQQAGFEVFSLALFAQFANLHLSLLRDGVIAGYSDAEPLQQRIVEYTAWCQQWFLQGYADRLKANSDFNYVNAYVRHMQTSVMDFVGTWKYFDPTQYPNAVNVSFDSEIYETASESYPSTTIGAYLLPSPPTGPISQINTANLYDFNDQYFLLQGGTVGYTGGGIGACKTATPAYPTRCVCALSSGSCYIQVGGLDPNATDSSGNYINNVADTSCCATNGSAVPWNQSSCIVASTLEECENTLQKRTTVSTGYQGVTPALTCPDPLPNNPPACNPNVYSNECNINNVYYCNGGTNIPVSPMNPIVAASGLFDNSNGIYYVNFSFADGNSTGEIPSQGLYGISPAYSCCTTPFTYDHSGNGGYYLSSLFLPNGDGYYQSASDVVFGWKLRPRQICTPGPGSSFGPVANGGWLRQLDTNQNGDLWGITGGATNNIFMRLGTGVSPDSNTGTGWMQPPDGGELIQVSVGLSRPGSNIPSVWGIGTAPNGSGSVLGQTSNYVYFRNGITGRGSIGTSWSQVDSTLCSWVSVGDDGSVWCSAINGIVYRRDGITQNTPMGTSWIPMTEAINAGSRIAVNAVKGSALIYIIAADGNLWSRTNITPTNPNGLGWQQIDSNLKDISLASDGTLWAIDGNNNLKVKTVSAQNPAGTAWTIVPWTQTPTGISTGAINIVWGLSNERSSNVYRRSGFICN